MRLGAEIGLSVEEQVFTRHDLYTADEVFLTGTAAEIVPVVKIDNRAIGRGRPGKITARLMREFQKLTPKEGVKYEVLADAVR